MAPESDAEVREAFPIVAVGGSAGSLGPFRELLSRLPAETPLAVVIVSHQDPERPSLLAEILAKSSQMPVAQVTDGTRATPGRVYVAPPGHDLGMRQGVFALERPRERGHPPLPVDFFMRSLAEDARDRSVGVVCSGTGSDASLGLAAIRHAAGLTLAQDPESAEFAGMPRSAIAAGVVDLVLSLAQIAERLIAHARRRIAAPPSAPPAPPETDELERILALVAEHTGHDFSGYKRGTLRRRVERRLQLHGQHGLAEYRGFVAEHPEELEALWRDWLIGVSAFFRDPPAFEALERTLLDSARDRLDGGDFRVWVPGCATGQEAYSVAILLLDAGEKLRKRLEPQVFATDIDDAAIEHARSGRYPEGIAVDVGPDRLRRYFTVEDRHFVVKKDVRERVVFAVQNVLRDPPFTRMDLICCRNLLIYLQNDVQQRLLQLFHYSLNPGGLLFLGASESITGLEELYSFVDREQKIFRRRESARTPYSPADWAVRASGSVARLANAPEGPRQRVDLGELLRRQLADRYAPPALVIDEEGRVEHIHGRTGDYLEPAPGQPSLNALDMARDGLRAPLASALREIARGGPRSVERDARVRTSGGEQRVRVRLSRLSDARISRALFLVSFEPAAEPAAPAPPSAEAPASETPQGDRVQQLEEDLRSTREDQQSSIEELQAANEELASVNEEVQSVNEELQSTNEELQTSKEEIQSLNEELHTVNAELRAKLASLEQANDDMRNLMDSTGIAIVFVDESLRLKRFTPAARALFPLIASDIGRPLSDISTSLDDPDLLAQAEEVLRTLIPSEREVRATDGKWYAVHIRPYRTARNTIEGVSIAFLDVTLIKQLALEEDVVQAVREPFLVLDTEFRVVRANRSFYRLFRVEPAAVEGCRLFDLGDGQWDILRLRELLEHLLPENQRLDDFRVEHDFPGVGRRVILLNARRVERGLGRPELILLAMEDVTDRSEMSV